MLKVKILIKPGLDTQNWESEEQYKHRFFFTMIDEHIKIVDVKMGKLFDFSTEKEYDQEAINGMTMVRQISDFNYYLYILCHDNETNRNFVRKIILSKNLVQNLDIHSLMQIEAQKKGYRQKNSVLNLDK